MKYIRTKDGRILKGSNYGFGVGMPYKNYDVKVADTIQELCDEFVIFNPTIEQKEYLVKWLGKDKIKYKTGQQQEGFITPYETLFGAIWTEWGLKYVAKMNIKGEFELI